MKKILPFICTMFISFSAWGVTCDAGYYLPDGADECVVCPAGKYSEAGASSCSNVSAGYFCSGGCTTATPTSDEDCLTGNTCGQCLTDSVTGRDAYSGAGAASCSVCPEVTGDLAGRVKLYGGWWSGDIHKSIEGCVAGFNDDDPDGTYKTNCYYSTTDGTYGGANSRCETRISYIEACAAGKYNTIESTSEWNGEYAVCRGVDCMKGKVCTGTTDAGYYSPEGATTQTACPVGTYSATAGAAACSYASPGYYATGCTDGTACTGQSQCTGTTYCADGVQYSCPTGYTENTTDGKSAASQCQTTCPAGNYMASGTYTQLEYLKTTGTQYIDTGVSGPATWNITAQSDSFSGNTNRTLIARGTFTPLWFGALVTSGKWGAGGSSGNHSSVAYTTKADMSITFESDSISGTVNSSSFSRSGSAVNTWNNYILFAYNDNYYFTGNVYSAKCTRNDTIVRDMIPVRRNSDSVLGMLDLVSGQFFTNAGTGTFVAGPDVAQIGGTCTASSAGYYATATTTIGYGTPAPQTACESGTYSAAVGASSASTCTACPAGKYSTGGASSCSNVSAGYFCSGGCTTATPTSDEDCLTGNTCGQCLTDSVTGREAYSGAGAASCSVCPEVTGDLAGRARGYSGWWSGDIHQSIGGCKAVFYDDDPDGTYRTSCYYSTKDGTYGGANSRCETRSYNVEACAAGKYNTITSASGWDDSYGYARCNGVDCIKGEVCTDTTAGYYSPEGEVNQTACESGTYSATAGAAACSYVSPGYYTTGCTDGTACTGQSQCTGTTYCAAGVQYSCPTGYTENTTDGKSSVTQCQTTCPAGNYMANGAYTQLEYLSSTTAGQYIDTGITFEFAKDLRILSSFINPDTTQRHILVGTYRSNTPKSVLNVELRTSGNFRVYTVADGSVKEKSSAAKLPANTLISYDLSYSATNHTVSTSLQYGNTTTDVQVTTATSTSNTPSPAMRLFLDYRGGGINQPVSIGETKIYKEGALVFDGVPARRNSDNELGFLDLVSGQFLTNAGSGTFVAGPDVAQIGGTCSASSAGHYATATTIGYGTPAPQTACPLNTYSASGAASCTACATGTFAPTASPVCYPHILHVGNDVVYVRSTKLTTPSLNIDIDRDGVADFFVNMTTTRTRMNKDSEHYFHAQWENNDYYICDDTTCPQ